MEGSEIIITSYLPSKFTFFQDNQVHLGIWGKVAVIFTDIIQSKV